MNELAKSIAELIATINKGANGVGESFQKVAPDAWKVAVYHAKVQAWTTLACVLGLAAIVFAVGLKFWQMQRKNDDLADQAETGKEPGWKDQYRAACSDAEGFAFGKWCAFCIAALITVLGITANLDEIMNPEYEAASQLSARFLGK